MLPVLANTSHLGLALTAFYVFLGVSSLSAWVAIRNYPIRSLRMQIDAWWRVFPAITAGLLLYPLGPALLAAVICLLSVRELSQYADLPCVFRQRAHSLLAAGLLLGVFNIALLQAVLLAGLAAFGVRRNTNALLWMLYMLTALGVSFLARFVDFAGGLTWLFYLFALTALNDVGQFISGKLFGRHNIAPSISPNKTWEGLVGGLLVSQLLSLLIGAAMPLHAAHLQLYALALSIAGFAGDLLYSAAKRHLGIKDFSELIPGHGGMLDRADSLVLTAPLLYFLLRTFEPGST